ncbi:MAG: hypothetical protein EI684_05120 [Candidatus Viridilinea halotolerans]|uniref:Phage tail protein n=1 Tax=Candidatus Viridilinea halotolerans TaxID=2491704 RepID=A0A426U5R2_9CHLR|nr:MAG: hypothetical protein EI684_05120 [Candidatus Viridilinea halotolerans]
MTNVASNIIVTGARVFLAPVSSPAVLLPAPTVPVDGAWPTGWVSVGFTLEPTKLTYKFDVLQIFVEQSYSPIRRRRTKEEANVETVLAEHTAGNMALTMAGLATQTAAAGSVPGYETMSVGGDPNLPVYMVGIEGGYNDEASDFLPIRLFVWLATVSDGATLEYGKDKVAGLPLKLDALSDVARPRKQQLFSFQRVLGVATPPAPEPDP